jgi:hypothetical protein
MKHNIEKILQEKMVQEERPRDFATEAENIVNGFNKQNKINPTAEGIISNDLLATITREILKEEKKVRDEKPQADPKALARALAIELDRTGDWVAEKAKRFLDETYLHPEEKKEAI